MNFTGFLLYKNIFLIELPRALARGNSNHYFLLIERTSFPAIA